MTSATTQLRRQLIENGADPFQLAAEAIDRSNRLMSRVNCLEQALSQYQGGSSPCKSHFES